MRELVSAGARPNASPVPIESTKAMASQRAFQPISTICGAPGGALISAASALSPTAASRTPRIPPIVDSSRLSVSN
jgi:hypothetical protein